MESIAAKDHNNLYRASRYLRDRDRYEAFCAMYAVMRIVDDGVDELAAVSPLASESRLHEAEVVRAWHEIVASCWAARPSSKTALDQTDSQRSAEIAMALKSAFRRFPTPAILWDDFFTAMRLDLVRDRFVTFSEFVRYAQGATVSPTTIYLYLITAQRLTSEDTYRPPPGFDLIKCGYSLGLFAYIAHILRDLVDDLSVGERGLLYLAADDMATHGVTEAILRRDLEHRTTSPPVRSLVEALVQRARQYARLGRQDLLQLEGTLSTDRAFILELIVRMYEAQLKKIIECSYHVMSDAHKLSDGDKERIATALALEVVNRHTQRTYN